jgi:hypothetical protein
MALSEHEQQLLDDMERRLYQSEADVMQTDRVARRLNMRSLVLGILVVLAGIGALIAGAGLQLFWLGLVGFVIMLAGALLAFSQRESEIDAQVQHGKAPQTTASRESLGDRMSRRWEERMDGER